jgi:DNA-directed RNA polymerase subunit beta-beta'
MEDGTPVDIVLNSLGVPSRMNLGQIFESVCGMISHLFGEKMRYHLATNNLDKVRELMGKVCNAEVESWDEVELLERANEVVRKGLGVMAMPFCSPTISDMEDMLEYLGVDKSCKYTLHDGQTGERLFNKVAVGKMYIMRLNHDVDDKAHARSTGPYGLITQQPLGGKAQSGGQRVGEMEVHALQAFGAAYTLLEILTVKSDDIQGRLQAFDALVRGDDRFTVNTPESFKIFCLYAKALCLNVSYIDHSEGDIIPGLSDYSISPRLPEVDIRFSIASPSDILAWSYGAVESTETNYHRTDRPVHKGLFCARIFGPVVSFECSCGKYKRMKYRGIVCERCEVEVTHSKVRRERMGHIALAVPVTHVWFTRILPSRIGMLLNMSIRVLESILGCETYVVTNPGNTEYTYGQMLSVKEYDRLDLSESSYAGFSAETGGEVIETLLKSINLEEEEEVLAQELAEATSEAKRKKVSKKLELVRQLLKSGTRPEYMTIRVLPVIPAALRPIVVINDGYGRTGTLGLNDLYKAVLNRNNRFQIFERVNAPDEIKRNEKRSLQQGVDTLLDNGRNGVSVSDNSGRKYRGVASFIKGKQGICRQDILGKRVDYSGRSVIVVGPDLRLDQCALPRKMALELFKPHVMAKLESYGLATTLRGAKRLIEQEVPEVWDILAEVIKDHPVLLNRAPTLHRLGIQAFNPVLTSGKSIRVHPLVCAAFNADFDGDQMSVHVPLSVEARLEAHFIMLSTENLLNPANGMPIIAPSQDIVLGIYELTHVYDEVPRSDFVYSGFDEVVQQHYLGRLGLQDVVRVLHEGQETKTTPGRIVFYQSMPEGIEFESVNRVFKKKDIGVMLYDVYRAYGSEVMARFADDIKDLGFKWATKSGLTVGKDDFIQVKGVAPAIEKARNTISEYEAQQREGLVARTELTSKSIDVWTKCTEEVMSSMMSEIAVPGKSGLNTLYKALDSGARGSPGQLLQMLGVRGLVTTSSNTILEYFIVKNYRNGVSIYDLFVCCHGSRKGNTDVALKTAVAGHMSRRLVEACQNCVVMMRDCGTTDGIEIKSDVSDNGEKISVYGTVKGRVLAEDLVHPTTKEVLISSGTLIGDEHQEIVDQLFVNKVCIRSPVKCSASEGICALCYGVDLSQDKLVSLGEVVGVVAAQSIGEPGAQLTMNTFHSGGLAQRASTRSDITTRIPGTVQFTGKCVVDQSGHNVVVSRNAELRIMQDSVEMVYHRVPYGAQMLVEDGKKVKAGTKLAEWDPYSSPIVAERDSRIVLHDVVEGISLAREVDELTGIETNIISDWRHISGSFQPRIEIIDDVTGKFAVFSFAPGSFVEVADGQMVRAGQVVARTPKGSFVSEDITGGLPRVSELLEARQNPKTQALLSDLDGVVEYGSEYRGRNKLIVRAESGEKREYHVPQNLPVFAQSGDFVRRGDQLTGGSVSAHCILRILGVDAVVSYLIKEVQGVYQMQGAHINSKHLEIVIRQMLQKREVVDPGDSDLIAGNYIDRADLEEVNRQLISEGLKPAVTNVILMGITNSVIYSRSALSSVSFQNSIRTFLKESLAGKVSRVSSPKDYVVIAALMNAGTGFVPRHWVNQLKQIESNKEVMLAGDGANIADEFELESGDNSA